MKLLLSAVRGLLAAVGLGLAAAQLVDARSIPMRQSQFFAGLCYGKQNLLGGLAGELRRVLQCVQD